MSVEKEFIPCEESSELKELGFDEPCIGRYNVPGEFILSGCYSDSPLISILVEQNDICESHTLAPTFSQAFRWFREKHNLHYFIDVSDGIWFFERWSFDGYKTYEEAELACLKKLIEIVKEKL